MPVVYVRSCIDIAVLLLLEMNIIPLHLARYSGSMGSSFGGLSCTGVLGSNLPVMVSIVGRKNLIDGEGGGKNGVCLLGF